MSGQETPGNKLHISTSRAKLVTLLDVTAEVCYPFWKHELLRGSQRGM